VVLHQHQQLKRLRHEDVCDVTDEAPFKSRVLDERCLLLRNRSPVSRRARKAMQPQVVDRQARQRRLDLVLHHERVQVEGEDDQLVASDS
jgi:hypothetical protein